MSYRIGCVLLAATLGHWTSTLFAQTAPIEVDGSFTDWNASLATSMDLNVPASGVDLLDFQVTNDGAYLFLKLDLGQEIDLVDELVPHSIQLGIDADDDPSTGTVVQAGYGCELRVRFDTRTVYYNVGGGQTLGMLDLGIVPLPTTTGTSFEMAIPLDIVPDGIHPLFTGSVVRIVFQELDGGDVIPEAGQVFSYTIDGTPVAPWVPIDLDRSDTDLVRITAWNVLNSGLEDPTRAPAFERMLQALRPDVIGFVECYNTTAPEAKALLDAWLPIGGAGWHVLKKNTDMILASRWPILQSWTGLDRQFPVLIDLPPDHPSDLLVSVAHFNCCTADAARQDQADAFAQFMLDAKSPGGTVTLPANTPVALIGDLNLVGYAQQLTTLLTGAIQSTGTYGAGGPLDWDGTDLAATVFPLSDERMAYTWAPSSGSYPPGRLDYFIHTDAAMTVMKAFAVRTERMSGTRLAQYGLLTDDSGDASDHLPITSDVHIGPIAQVALAPRLFLDGPYESATGMMRDDLRAAGLVPLGEPYSAMGMPQVGGGGETTSNLVLSATGNDAIVDWVRLEIREAADPTVIAATRQALLQRDGDVVMADGTAGVSFDAPPGDYYVVVRHRNHLGCMTAATIALSASSVPLDLADPSAVTFGTAAMKSVVGAQTLWPGDATGDGMLKYTGAQNDRDPILGTIGGTTPTATATGYFGTDINMDGVVKYAGAQNDRDPILVNIGGTIPTATRVEQLP
ncbi:MAG: endonuclease/exonuclease/phosphatase family protein [Flavobacteriales bacterium]|nr:endonuclease/exonuclease/phosphatase family protein [Flavobacteriales bacterium]MCB9166375.1 endonuclease/exonuclease/phosphatase family protein [Flavobacteriales bacterium]